jgi:hypothetical protein
LSTKLNATSFSIRWNVAPADERPEAAVASIVDATATAPTSTPRTNASRLIA